LSKPDLGNYYELQRDDVADLVPIDVMSVLDIGCGTGILGSKLIERHGCNVTGIELNETAAAAATDRLDRVIVGDIEEILDNCLEDLGTFDCIIMSDVLEHLRNPWEIIRIVARLIEPSGILIVSVPNAAHFSVIGLLIIHQRWHTMTQVYLTETIYAFSHCRKFLN
jgi:hypothetical protein